MADRLKAMITGASEGIGRTFAISLSQQGYDVTVVARSEARLQELVSELAPGAHKYLVADLVSEAGVSNVAEELQFGSYDLLVNNAGISKMGLFHELPLQEQLDMMRLNCEALVSLAHAFLQNASHGAALLNVGSLVGLFPFPTQSIYAASKAFVVSLTEALWYEQRERGVFVMVLCPSSTATTFFDRAGIEQGPPRGITQTPEQVVAKALKALDKRSKPICISGAVNTVLANVPRLLPRKAVVSIIASSNPLVE